MPEAIRQQRQSVIIQMVDAALFYLHRYIKGEASKPICRHPNPTHDCDLVILGSVTKEYQSRIGLCLNIADEDHVNYDKFLLMSIKEVAQLLKSITIHFLGATSTGLGGHAHTCSFLPELFKKISHIVIKVEGLKLESFDSRRKLLVLG